ncbi:MAG: bacterial Ig-like domain-containing protein [Clostridiales bacterium]|nr:bacterial Ig-like domain-containing protein [Clostridiales bacterium]
MVKRIFSFSFHIVILISAAALFSVFFSAAAGAEDTESGGTYLVTASEGLKVYSSASESADFLTIIPMNTYITAISTSGTYAYTTYDAVYGWVNLSSGAEYISSKPSITENGEIEGVKSIAVTQLPSKLTYIEGEEDADIDGLEVSAVFDDENGTKMAVEGYTVSFPSLDSYGTKTVTVYYAGYSTTFKITVAKVPVTGIVITLPEKTSYVEGETISFDGLTVTAYFSDGRDGGNGITLTSDEYTVSGITEGTSALSPGAYTVTVTYKYPEISAEFHIYVSEKQVVTLKLLEAPAGLTIYRGQTFDTADFVLSATYDNGETETITDFDIEYDNMTIGTHTARIYYMGKYVAFDYEVLAVFETSIALGDTTAVGSYTGNNVDFSELHVYLVYNSGDRDEIFNYELTYDIDTDTTGTYRVYVSYKDFTASFLYTVADKSNIRLGDANCDGTVNAADARLALRYAAGLEDLTADGILAADVNLDGKVTASDARTILRAAAGLEVLSV